MNILISPRAEKELKKLHKFDQIAVVQKIRSLRLSTPHGEERLTGYPHIFRVRVGNYRIVYRKTRDDIYIILIRHRKDVYKKLTDLLG
ncbi:MAG TPA: type II toxin-antitoxin system RelE/ParE family toxin [Patescibacteria group bacterium]|jgi:mRNA interferase RelE/StbE|nr:type II toxin-antitoxin system RelE/ParE family toxin [Patescibacteria group bacterium]